MPLGYLWIIKDIASAENTTPRYVRRLLQIAWLAPDIMEAILDVKQPAGLNPEPSGPISPSPSKPSG